MLSIQITSQDGFLYTWYTKICAFNVMRVLPNIGLLSFKQEYQWGYAYKAWQC